MTPEERAAKLAAEILRECDRHDATPIIAAAIRDAVKAEREACAEIAASHFAYRQLTLAGNRIAAAIRERPL